MLYIFKVMNKFKINYSLITEDPKSPNSFGLLGSWYCQILKFLSINLYKVTENNKKDCNIF